MRNTDCQFPQYHFCSSDFVESYNSTRTSWSIKVLRVSKRTPNPRLRGYVTDGRRRALEWHLGGQRFDPAYLHQSNIIRTCFPSGTGSDLLFISKTQRYKAKRLLSIADKGRSHWQYQRPAKTEPVFAGLSRNLMKLSWPELRRSWQPPIPHGVMPYNGTGT